MPVQTPSQENIIQMNFGKLLKNNVPYARRTIHVLMTGGSWTPQIQDCLHSYGAQRVTIATSYREMESAYPRATHVLIPGGADIDPLFYGEECLYAQPYAPDRDALEYELVLRALSDAKPLFGICRGHQMIAVAAGGSLYQDLGKQRGRDHASSHLVYVRPGSKLAAVIGTAAHVNSYHHQAVRRVPVGFRAVARTHDKTIEAMESSEYPVLSVQWHPEVLHDQASQRLFSTFLSMQ